MDLFHNESDIIANIFSHLNFRDRISLAATCTELNYLHNNRRELWKSVWFDVRKASSATSNQLRQYSNVSIKFSDYTDEHSIKDILTPLAPAIKALKLYYTLLEKPQEDCKFIETIVEFLQMVAQNLESLDLDIVIWDLYGDIIVNLPVNVNKVITLVNLKYLKMQFNMFAAFQRHIDFSQSKNLRSIHIDPGVRRVTVSEDDNVKARLALFNLITQQSALKSLKLSFSSCVCIFDNPLILGCKLDELEIRDGHFSATTLQLENMLDFIESQNQLKSLRAHVESRDDITPRMWRFNASVLDEPREKQIISNRGMPHIISNENCYVTTDQLCRIFRSQHIQPNEIATEVELQLMTEGNHRHHHQDWLISGLVRKYLKMKIFSIESEHGPMPNLASLTSSIHLSTLSIRVNRRLGSSLRDVNISGLKVFKLTVSKSLMLNRDFVQLKKFLSSHNKLTELRLQINPEEDDIENLHAVKKLHKNIFDLLKFAIENLPELTTIGIKLSWQTQLKKAQLQAMISSYKEFTFFVHSRTHFLAVKR